MADAETSEHFSDLINLSAIETDCWRLLQAAVHDKSCGWRLPALATCFNGELRQRTVVLRKVDTPSHRIFVHTDVRSPKLKSIRSNPNVSWLFYDTTRQVQLQLTGFATVHTDDDVADRVWGDEAESSLRGYLAPYVPGSVQPAPEFNLPPGVQGRIPLRHELSAARANFVVISCAVATADWLLLQAHGNLQARFTYESGAVSTADWLAP
ncbi:MAG: pyridoxamine 5'-phosphate oxidase family protein [Fuerstiella sp.]